MSEFSIFSPEELERASQSIGKIVEADSASKAKPENEVYRDPSLEGASLNSYLSEASAEHRVNEKPQFENIQHVRAESSKSDLAFRLTDIFHHHPDSLVVVGDQVAYYGKPLEAHEFSIGNIPIITKKYSESIRQHVEVKVYAITEGMRVVAYSTDIAKAKSYIESFGPLSFQN